MKCKVTLELDLPVWWGSTCLAPNDQLLVLHDNIVETLTKTQECRCGDWVSEPIAANGTVEITDIQIVED